jgi:hypothetical protein
VGAIFTAVPPPSPLGLGLLGGLGPVVGHRTTLRSLSASRLLPRNLLGFLDRACVLGVMYPTGPGFRFRHRTVTEMLARSHWSV